MTLLQNVVMVNSKNVIFIFKKISSVGAFIADGT